MKHYRWYGLAVAALCCMALQAHGGQAGHGSGVTAPPAAPGTHVSKFRDRLPPHFLQMQFSLLPGSACVNGRCGRLALARGEFVDDRALRDFNQWWDGMAPKERPVMLLLDSRGGDVEAAVHLARRIRALGLDTGVSDGDVCVSACVYVLMGGVVRKVDEGALLGVHAVTQQRPGSGMGYREGERITAALLNHFADMGVSAVLMDAVFGSLSPTQVVRLGRACITASRLDNTEPAASVAQPCGRPPTHYETTPWVLPDADMRTMIEAVNHPRKE